ncbi:MAG: hypothetical protein V7704_07655 [Aurantimonas endophytica]|jgi:hypothetical protein|uniref:HicA-like toxin of HicAB toxin-antitoxin system n=1 Tax=Aurantimonas endophytica TaxID=1522175 RepID=A0A7W6HFK5_9HYPH|nr:hypothetical protein [Aurantimonas endophytica]MBB4004092.1 hypothetical protein [Aurantimonas endophytica]MCO6404937.1 hypothetical protein [Aurantimonas endophytica]
MTREALLRELRAYARAQKLKLEIDTKLGKGSHYRVTLGDRRTIIQSGELGPLHVRTIKRQLGVK